MSVFLYFFLALHVYFFVSLTSFVRVTSTLQITITKVQYFTFYLSLRQYADQLQSQEDIRIFGLEPGTAEVCDTYQILSSTSEASETFEKSTTMLNP